MKKREDKSAALNIKWDVIIIGGGITGAGIFNEAVKSGLTSLLLEQKDLVEDSLNELFRFFHTYKATSAYLALTPLNDLVCKTETVLSSLREEKKKFENL